MNALPRRILFCADFSENSLAARGVALEYALCFQAELHVVHVINSAQFGYPSLDGVPVDIKAIIHAIRESAEKALRLTATDCCSIAERVFTHCRVGNPPREIAKISEELDVDLIVMGTHGWTGFRHLILGSVAQHVLRSARCPVLTVRSPESRS
jgi:universal stress protein A